MITLLYLFIAISLLKFVINLTRHVQCKSYLRKYHDSLRDASWEFEKHVPQVIRLLKSAGLQEPWVSYVQPAGWGYVITGEVSVFHNITNRREDIVGLTIQAFHRAIGVYRSRMLETFSPLYWIEFVISLPKQVLSYLGVSAESVVIKVAQLIYWAIAAVFGFLLALYRLEIDRFVRGWINKLGP